MSPHTDSNYRRDLKRFVAHCDKNGVTDWSRVDGQHVRSFAAAEHRGGSSPRTIQRRLSALRSFYNFLLREGAVKLNPAVDVQAPKAKKRLPATIDVDQMTRLLSFRTDEEISVRDKAMMELFYSSGLRLVGAGRARSHRHRPGGSHGARARQGQQDARGARSAVTPSRPSAAGCSSAPNSPT